MKKNKFLWGLLISCCFALSSCDNNSYVTISTEYGDVTVLLYDFTPKHKENFLKLVDEGYYDDLLFHRIISGFMIQGGDPDSKEAQPGQRLGGGGPGYRVDAEIGSPHFRGALAAARDGNPQKASSGSQFYIVHGSAVTDAMLDQIEQRQQIQYSEAQRQLYREVGGTPQLDNLYTVFGEVVSGMEVVDQIAAEQKDQYDRPVKDVKMSIRKGK